MELTQEAYEKRLSVLNETKKQVIKTYVQYANEEEFHQDMKRRIKFEHEKPFKSDILLHKYHNCLVQLHRDYDPILKAAGKEIPENPDAFAELVFSLAEYKPRTPRG